MSSNNQQHAAAHNDPAILHAIQELDFKHYSDGINFQISKSQEKYSAATFNANLIKTNAYTKSNTLP